jgi:CIC family chloride channel protein
MNTKKIYKQTKYFLHEISRSKIILQAILVGILAGMLVVLFRISITKTFSFIQNFVHNYKIIFLFPFITTIGGLISGILVWKFAPETKGSGIPFVKMVLTRMGKVIRLRSIFIKFFAGVFGIGSGLSLGREGPSVQLGAGVGELIGKIFRMKGTDKNKLIATGAGSAIAATFNAPIAGTIFVLEELVNKFSSNLLFPVIIATVSADTISRHILGNKPCFIIPNTTTEITLTVLFCAVILGIVSAFMGVLFSKIIFFNNKVFSKIQLPNFVKPAIAGFVVGLIGLFVPLILGSGNIAVDILLAHKLQFSMVLIIFFLKLFVTPLCFGSGAAGGIFLPTLMLGAFLGYILAYLFNYIGLNVDYVLMCVLTMGAFLSAVARTPITASVMVFEMTASYNLILPILLSSAIADLISEKLGHKPIYSMLIVNDMIKTDEGKILSEIKVKNVMKRNVEALFCDESLIEINEKYQQKQYSTYPVVNRNQRLLGFITKSNIDDMMLQENKTIVAEKFMNPNPITILENENLYIAYFRLHSNDINCLFVVDRFNKLKGILTREDIVKNIQPKN